MKVSLTSALVLSLLSLNVAAEDQWNFGLGIGVQNGKSMYKGVGTETNPFPFFSAQKGNFKLIGNRAEYHLIDNGKFQLKALGHYRLEGFEADDSSFLAGMSEREGALELGIGTSLTTAAGQFSTSLLSDVSGTHEGHELSIGWEKTYPLNAQWLVKPSAKMHWRSEDLNNYYYGVASHEATVDRLAYTADSGTSYQLGIDAFYLIDQQQTVQVGISTMGWSNEISNSSIVEDDNTTYIKAAYSFRF